jgi:putative Mg2+ transporter-C (MgtC) family protein
MLDLFEPIRNFDFLSVTIRLVLALIFGGFIGLERGKQGRAAGMRTHILVCIGSALTVMIGIFATVAISTSSDPLRIAAQVVSGIGFLGVGTILVKGRFQITGLTTAAGLWSTAAIGLALGAGFFEGAIIAFICTFFTIAIFHKLEYKFHRWNSRVGIYIEINSDTRVRDIIEYLTKNYAALDIQITAPRSQKSGNIGVEAIINIGKNKSKIKDIYSEIESLDYVLFTIESI